MILAFEAAGRIHDGAGGDRPEAFELWTRIAARSEIDPMSAE